MATTSTITYCTEADIHDVYSDFKKYDNKTRILGWKLGASNISSDASQDTIDVYYADNVGFVHDLYIDGSKVQEIDYSITKYATTLSGLDAMSSSSLPVNSISNFASGDFIKIGNEYIQISGTSGVGPVITFSEGGRGMFGTGRQRHGSTTTVSNMMSLSLHVTIDTANAVRQFMYDSDLDKLFLITTNNPQDFMVESGLDYSAYLTRIIKKASRMLESQLDSRMSREIMKDREGNYPAYIVQATALKAVILMLKANDPANEYIRGFEQEYNEIIRDLHDGKIVLPSAVTQDSSKGVLREVSIGATTDLRPVELRGHHHGSDYELLKIKIEAGENGVIGTSKYTVYASDGDNLKADVIVDSEIINGRFQTLGVGSLQIRWGGDDVVTAITNENDEYEIELHGYYIDTSSPNKMGSIRMTRTGLR